MLYTKIALFALPAVLLAQDINVSSIVNGAENVASSAVANGQPAAATAIASADSSMSSPRI